MDEERKKAFDRAKKLKALADRGVGGEKENAKSLLKKHLEKHGISEQELEESIKQYEYFRHERNQEALLSMIIAHVVCNALILRDTKRHKNTLFLECSKEEAAKIRKMFEFYINCYKIEEGYLLQAFLHKHNLIPNIAGYNGDGKVNSGVIKPEGKDKFHVTSEPTPVQEVKYTEREQKKIRGIMSWMPRYEMTDHIFE